MSQADSNEGLTEGLTTNERADGGPWTTATAAASNTSWVFSHRLRQAGLLGSIGWVASSVDNSMIESF
jgi:putative transposase